MKKAEPKNALLMASEANLDPKLSETSWSNAARAPTAPMVVGAPGIGVIPLVQSLVPGLVSGIPRTGVSSPRDNSGTNEGMAEAGTSAAGGMFVLGDYVLTC